MKQNSFRKRFLAMMCAVMMLFSSVDVAGLSEVFAASYQEEMKVGDTKTLTTLLTADETQGQTLTWSSSDDTIESVTVNADNNKEAAVTALAAGKVTVSAVVKDAADTVIDSDEWEFTVTENTVIAQQVLKGIGIELQDSLDQGAIPVTQKEFTLKAVGYFEDSAGNQIAGELGNDVTVTWEVGNGAEYVSVKEVQGFTAVLEIGKLDSAKADVTVSVKASNGMSSLPFTVTVTKSEPTIEMEKITLHYGDTEPTLTAKVNGAVDNSVKFSIDDPYKDIAEVTEEGRLTLKKAGKFSVKADFAGNDEYLSKTLTQELTVQPRSLSLSLNLNDSTPVITKTSNGNTSLEVDDKTALLDYLKNNITVDNGLSGKEVTLDIVIDDIAYANTDPTDPENYDAADPENYIDLGKMVITIASVKDDEAGNYALDTNAIAAIQKIKFPGYITAVEDSVNGELRMEKEASDKSLQNDKVIFEAGKLGNDGEYWYDAKGIRVTLGNDVKLVSTKHNGNMGRAEVVKDGYLTINSGEKFFIKENGVGYGPYTVSYKKDSDAPKIALKSVKLDKDNVGKDEIIFNKAVIYTVGVSDINEKDGQQGSGVAFVEYAIANKKNAKPEDITDWQQLKLADLDKNEDGYSFQVTVDGGGYLYARATDHVGNSAAPIEIRPLVLESTAPRVTELAVTPGGYQQGHTVKITARDDGSNLYSGIAKITYTLIRNEDGFVVYNNEEIVNVNVPEKMEDLSKDDIKKMETDILIEKFVGRHLLDGTYTLEVKAVDNCGNSSITKSKDLYFDNTAPKYTISMQSPVQPAADGKYYYKADNCGLNIEMFNARPMENVEYTVNVGGMNKTGTVTADADGNISTVISLADDEIVNGIQDGKVVVTVSLKDDAGNVNAKADNVSGMVSSEKNGVTEASFILDTKKPVVKNIVTMKAGTTEAADAKGVYDNTDYYYNTDLAVIFTVEEVNPENSLEPSVKKNGEDYSIDAVKGNKVVFRLDKEGKYTEFTVSGHDLAGNPLVLDSSLLQAVSGPDAAAEAAGTVTMTYNKIIDKTAPVAKIIYTEVESDHLYDNNIDGNDDRNADTAYYNKNIIANITVTDAYGKDTATELDACNLYFGNTAAGTPAGTDHADTTASVTYEWNTDGEYYVSVYGTDRAGNSLTVKEYAPDAAGNDTKFVESKDNATAYTANYHLVRDTKKPVYTLGISSANSKNADKNIQGNRYYFNGAFVSTVTVTESNFDAERIFVKRAFLAAADGVDSSAEEVNRGFDTQIRSTDANKYEYTETVTADAGDGIYRYQIYGTDRAGNALAPSANLSTGDNLEDTQNVTKVDDEDTSDLSVHAVLDTTNPVVNVDIFELMADGTNGTLFYEGFLNGTSVENGCVEYEQNNQPYRSNSKAKAEIKGKDFSPIQLSYDFESSNNNTNNEYTDYTTTGFVNNDMFAASFDGEQRVRIMKLKASDLAGNESIAKQVYDGAVSTWMYLDVKPPVYDELAPNVTMKVSGNLGGKAKGEVYGPDGNDLYVGNVDVIVQISDPNLDDIKASGLYKTYYKVEVNGKDWSDQVKVENLYSDNIGAAVTIGTGEVSYGTAGHGQPVQGNEKLTYTNKLKFTFDSETFNYNDLKLSVWAEDNSGNKIAESSCVSRRFGIDVTAPKISVSYDNNEAENEKYFKEDRTATIVVTERNFDESNTIIINQSEAAVSGWTHTSGSMDNGDADKWTCTVTYSIDGDYTFDVETTDLVGHSNEGDVDYGDSVAPTEFVIDKTAPEIDVRFDNEDVRNGKYYNAQRTATIEIIEHNFAEKDAEVITTAEIAKGSVTAPGITGWNSGDDRNVTTIPFDEDGDYTMRVQYVDLAGNEAEIKTVDEFTVDMTAPEIEVGGVEDHSANRGEVAPVITYHDINYAKDKKSVSIVGYKNKDGKNLNGTANEDEFGGSFVCTNIEEIPENDDVYLCTGYVEDMAGNSSEAELWFSVNRFGSNYILDEPTEKLVADYYTNEAPTIGVTEINVDTLEFREITSTLNGEIVELTEGQDYEVTAKGNEGTWKEYHYTVPAGFFKEDGAYNLTIHSRDAAQNENSNRTARVEEYSKPLDFVLDTKNPEVIISGVENGKQYVEDSRMITLLSEDNIGVEEIRLYLNEELAATYDAKTLAEANGQVTYEAKSQNDWQKLSVVVIDQSGNEGEQEISFLLTSNLWIQFIHNTPIMFGTIGGLIFLFFLLILWKRRKKDEDEEAES